MSCSGVFGSEDGGLSPFVILGQTQGARALPPSSSLAKRETPEPLHLRPPRAKQERSELRSPEDPCRSGAAVRRPRRRARPAPSPHCRTFSGMDSRVSATPLTRLLRPGMTKEKSLGRQRQKSASRMRVRQAKTSPKTSPSGESPSAPGVPPAPGRPAIRRAPPSGG